MTDQDDATWRDEKRTPVRELADTLGAPANDGQLDDMTGNDSGEESAFGHAAEVRQSSPRRERREMTDPDRAHRPSTTGRNGPH